MSAPIPKELEVAYLDSESWDGRMHDRFRWLREHDPVHWSDKDGIWLVTRYRDVEWVSKHQDPFSSAQGVRPSTPTKIGLIDEGEPHHGQPNLHDRCVQLHPAANHRPNHGQLRPNLLFQVDLDLFHVCRGAHHKANAIYLGGGAG